jgi:hypothetical protein
VSRLVQPCEDFHRLTVFNELGVISEVTKNPVLYGMGQGSQQKGLVFVDAQVDIK